MPFGTKVPRTRGTASIFKELRTEHASVDAEDDAISSGLRQFEENLAKLLRIRVGTLMSAEDTGHGRSLYRMLAFTKLESGWKLVIETGYDDDEPGEQHVAPLLSASREVRTEVVTGGYLQKLLETAVTELKEQVGKKRQARTALDQLNSDLLAEISPNDFADFGGEP